jgi:hypothetical protein
MFFSSQSLLTAALLAVKIGSDARAFIADGSSGGAKWN